MSAFDDALVNWLVRKNLIPEGASEVTIRGIRRDDGWTSDAGTSWDAETIVVYSYVTYGKTGQKHTKTKNTWAPSDIGEFLREILDD